MIDPATLPGLRFHTARDELRPTLGARQGAFGRIWLGQPFMPWQQLVADVLGELVPCDCSPGCIGKPAHPLGVVTVQRQAGKSHLALARTGERAMSRPGWRAWYTAQTGQHARDAFLKFNDEQIAGAPLEAVVHTLRGNGHEVMSWPNRSQLRPHPPTEQSLHSKQSDANDIDEAWAFGDDEGRLLMQAIAPTQLTRPHAQTVIWSAGGTAASTWLAGMVARGRAADPTLAYFEFAVPDELDVNDLDAMLHYHPAGPESGGWTVTRDGLAKLRTQLPDDDDFARAGGNRWTAIIGGAIDGRVWQAARWRDTIPADVPVAYGAARSADGSEAVLCAAALIDGRPVIELVDRWPAYGAAAEIRDRIGCELVTVAGTGAAAVLADDLQLLDGPVRVLTGRDEVAACGRLFDGLDALQIGIRQHEAFDAAVKIAGKRTVGHGGKAWAHTDAGSIAPMEAATWALSGLIHKPADHAPDWGWAE